MKQYKAYKDSGVNWLGETPLHWKVVRLKYLAQVKTGSRDTENKVDNAEYPFFVRSKKIERIDTYSYDGEAILTAGDGDICKIWHYINGKFDYHQRVYRISDFTYIHGKFLYYYLTDNFIKDVEKLSAKSTVDSLRLPMFQNFKVSFGSLAEQTQIANYLDKKTTQIDELIAKKEQLILLLEEERTAIINQAVTKGLNPDVPMKNSGIDWLGDIPEHWKNYRIDWIAKLIRGNTGLKKDELLDEGEYVALQYGKTYKVNEVNDSFKFYVNSEYYKENQIVNFGDTIIISTSETIEDLGHSCYYNRNDLGLIGGEQILLKPDSKFIFNKYLYYYTKRISNILQKYAKGLKVLRFKIDDLKQISIPLPPIPEQIEIVKFLDSEMTRISSLKKLYLKEIDLLKEYKESLISEVVTGKIDVREEVLN